MQYKNDYLNKPLWELEADYTKSLNIPSNMDFSNAILNTIGCFSNVNEFQNHWFTQTNTKSHRQPRTIGQKAILKLLCGFCDITLCFAAWVEGRNNKVLA